MKLNGYGDGDGDGHGNGHGYGRAHGGNNFVFGAIRSYAYGDGNDFGNGSGDGSGHGKGFGHYYRVLLACDGFTSAVINTMCRMQTWSSITTVIASATP